jgi:hypothetical protein
MNLANILTRRDPLKRAFVTLEDGMEDVLKGELFLPSEMSSVPDDSREAETGEGNELETEGDVFETDEANLASAVENEPASTGEEAPVEWQPEQDAEIRERVSVHSQSRLASHAAFDQARMRAHEDLTRIAEALTSIAASQHMSRQFLDDSYADILRANGLENANAAQAAENRRLLERVDKLERLRGRYDQLVEVLKRRETKLLGEAETMRETLGALRLELVEARSAIVRSESLHGELQVAHSARGGEVEHLTREAEMLREKNVGLSVELDLAQKKQAETRHRSEELSAMHASDSARLAEILARLVAEETESARLQKLNDALEAKLVEANENAARLAAEMRERDRHHHAEILALRGEIKALNDRLQSSANQHREMISHLNEMQSRAGDLESERSVLAKKLQALEAAPAHGDEASDTAEAGQLRRQIAELQATVARLKRFEGVYLAAKAAPPKGTTEVASGFSVEGGQIVPEFDPAKPAGHA